MFKIGEKVVCVNPIDDLKMNEIYTVKELVEAEDGLALQLNECECNEIYAGFCVTRFRKSADISKTTYNEVMEWIESGKPIEILN